MIKNPIIIKTTNNLDKITEKVLKQYIIENIEDVFKELGVGFAYMGSEVKLGSWYCDLLFFNIENNCYVVVEVKIRKFKNTDIGQIESYMNYIDKNFKKSFHEKTVGIVICKENNFFVTKYISNKNIVQTTYELI